MEENEKKLREIIGYYEARVKDALNSKVDVEIMKENLSTKASKADYGELLKKYQVI